MIVTRRILKKVYSERPPQAHKYDYGCLLVVAGSEKYSGPPIFVSMAAYRAGCDLVETAIPSVIADVVRAWAPEIIPISCSGNWFRPEHVKELLKQLHNKTAMVIGGGLQRRQETHQFVLELLKRIKLPCVIDADAIHSVALNPKVLKRNFIVTPHAYEFFVLTKKKLPEPGIKRVELVREEALRLGCTIVLKGNPDIISDGKRIALNRTGNPYMTVGGTGDTLAGIIGSLLAQKVDPFLAAQAGCFINGAAGDLVAKEKGPGLIPTDLIEKIPEVIKF